MQNGQRSPAYGVHWTTFQGEAGIERVGLIHPSHDLVWFQLAESLAQHKRILLEGDEGTGARGNRVGIVVDLTGLRPRLVGGGGVAFRLPGGLPLIGVQGRGITWYVNTGARGDVN